MYLISVSIWGYYIHKEHLSPHPQTLKGLSITQHISNHQSILPAVTLCVCVCVLGPLCDKCCSQVEVNRADRECARGQSPMEKQLAFSRLHPKTYNVTKWASRPQFYPPPPSYTHHHHQFWVSSYYPSPCTHTITQSPTMT